MGPDEKDPENDTREEDTTTITLSASGKPASSEQSACLIVVAGKTSVGKMFKLDGEMIIGRAGSAQIVLDDEGVSRRHAKVSLLPDGRVQINDLGSTNGTYLRGKRIDAELLIDGDKVQVGSAAVLKFSYQDELEEALQKNLYESATRDGLTHVYNKKYFIEALAKEYAYAARHNTPLAVLMVDVDHFKQVNDRFGHPAGDFVLHALAQRLDELVRAEDVVARYGGEEFAVILRETPELRAVACAERVRAAIEKLDLSFRGFRIRVTVSVGVATTVDEKVPGPAELVAAADEHLYRAKAAGRNRVAASQGITPK
jgi:two-component system, cell cycle response regulator